MNDDGHNFSADPLAILRSLANKVVPTAGPREKCQVPARETGRDRKVVRRAWKAGHEKREDLP